MKSSCRVLAILILTISLSIQQQPQPSSGPKVDPKYPQGLEVKTGIYALDTSAVFNYDNTKIEDLKVETSWAKIQVIKEKVGVTLPDTFKYAKILRFQTSQSKLEIVAFNRKTKMCLFTLFWESGLPMHSSLKISNEECKTLQNTKLAQNEFKLVTYIKDSGDMMYVILPKNVSELPEFTTVVDGDVYTSCLSKTELHQVTKVVQGTLTTDMILIYSTNSDNTRAYSDRICYLESDTLEGKMTKNTIFTKKEQTKFGFININYYDDFSRDYNILSVNLKEDFNLNYWSVLWMSIEHKVDNKKRLVTMKFNANSFKTGQKQNDMKFYSISEAFASADIQEKEVLKIMKLSYNGNLKICTPGFSAFKDWYRSDSECRNQIQKQTPEMKISEDEFVSDFSRRKDNVVVLSLMSYGDKDTEYQVVTNLGSNMLPPIDTSTNFYRAGGDVIYQIKKSFQGSDAPVFYSHEADIPLKRVYFLGDLITPPEGPITLTATAGDKKAEHILDIKFVDNFVQDKIDGTELFVTFKKSEIGKVLVDYNELIKYETDFVSFIPDVKQENWFSFTPLKMINQPSYTTKRVHRKLLITDSSSLTQQPQQTRPIESLTGCKMEDYSVFVDQGKITSFGFITERANKHFLLIDLQKYDITANSVRCVEEADMNLVLTKTGEDTYTAISFDFGGKGRFAIREFYSTIDITDIEKVFFARSIHRYKLILNNGAHIFLFFNQVFPIAKLSSDATVSGVANILKKQATIEITWE